MKNKLLLICIALLVLSCTKNEPKNDNSNVEVIDVNDFLDNDYFDTSKYRYDGHIIPLETTEDCLIDYFRKVFFSESRIFVKIGRQNQLFIFDFDGKYINKINIGNGKGDVAYLVDATFDNQRNELVVFDSYKYLKFYTPDGEFIREQEFSQYVYEIYSTKDGFILHNDYGNRINYEGMPNATMLYLDKDWNIKAAYLNQVIEEPITSYTLPSVQYNNITDITTLNLASTDTIYHFANEKLEAKYVLDYSSKKIDAEKTLDFNEFMNEIHYGDRLFYFGNYLETSTHQYFIISDDYYFYRDKKSKKIIGGSIDCRSGYPSFPNLLLTVYNDYFVGYLSPRDKTYKLSDYFPQTETDKLYSLDSDANPSLIFFKLKEFNEEE